jgi:hypothetical protein
VLLAGIPRLGENEDAPRDGALLGGAKAGDVPAATHLPPRVTRGSAWRQPIQVGDVGTRAVAAPGVGIGRSASSASAPQPCAAAQGVVVAVRCRSPPWL